MKKSKESVQKTARKPKKIPTRSRKTKQSEQLDFSDPTDEQIAVLLKIGKMLHG
jgi:hypothetical protein